MFFKSIVFFAIIITVWLVHRHFRNFRHFFFFWFIALLKVWKIFLVWKETALWNLRVWIRIVNILIRFIYHTSTWLKTTHFFLDSFLSKFFLSFFIILIFFWMFQILFYLFFFQVFPHEFFFLSDLNLWNPIQLFTDRIINRLKILTHSCLFLTENLQLFFRFSLLVCNSIQKVCQTIVL